MTICLGNSCSFGLLRVSFVNVVQLLCVLVLLLVLHRILNKEWGLTHPQQIKGLVFTMHRPLEKCNVHRGGYTLLSGRY